MKFPNRKAPNQSAKPRRRRRCFVLISMAWVVCLSVVCVLVFRWSGGYKYKRRMEEIQRRACGATRYPEACLGGQPPAVSNPSEMVSWALSLSAKHLKTAQSMVPDHILPLCVELLTNSARRTDAARDALSRGSLKDARAFASAVLVYQYDCWSALKYLNHSRTMSFLNQSLLVSTSNALSMLAALDTGSWAPPRTERSGFWEPVSESTGSDLGFSGGFPVGMHMGADATVCKGGCDFETVQAAVEAAPDGLDGGNRHVIHIKQGLYQEIVRVGFHKRNLVFVGDGMGKTIITASLNSGLMGITTYNTATVGVLGDGFMAVGITFENSAGVGAHQAVAFRSDSDLSLIEKCEFVGNQDTLYAHSLRQLYKSCRIIGNVDFIFGGAAAFFQNCTILVRPCAAAAAHDNNNNPNRSTNAITAHGRTDPAQSTGFVFFGCLVNGTHEYMELFYSSSSKAHKNYLGRPWKDYSRTVFLYTLMEPLIVPAGWLPWKGHMMALNTLYYAEYGNTGTGSQLSHRVPWSSRIPPHHISTYSANNFIQAHQYHSSLST